MMRNVWIPMAAVCGAIGVGMAAYAAHGLGFIVDPAQREAARSSLQMAVLMQMFHALALVSIGVLVGMGFSNRWMSAAGVLMVTGIVLFRCLIYLRVLADIQFLRQWVPLGGICLMLGWVAFGIASVRRGRRT